MASKLRELDNVKTFPDVNAGLSNSLPLTRGVSPSTGLNVKSGQLSKVLK